MNSIIDNQNQYKVEATYVPCSDCEGTGYLYPDRKGDAEPLCFSCRGKGKFLKLFNKGTGAVSIDYLPDKPLPKVCSCTWPSCARKKNCRELQ